MSLKTRWIFVSMDPMALELSDANHSDFHIQAANMLFNRLLVKVIIM